MINARILVLCLLLVGCQAARMPIPGELSTAERWNVEGRQGWKIRESLRVGPYDANDVERSWSRGRDQAVREYERSERDQHYSFVLREAGRDLWLVKCETALERRTVRTPLADVDLRNRSRLSCALSAADGPETWLLTLAESREHPLEGTLHTETGSFDVRGTTELIDSLPTPATSGYYITQAGRPVAAIEVINKGAVTVDGNVALETKSLLTAAAATLLLLEDLRATLDA